jgi:hypothetical protein
MDAEESKYLDSLRENLSINQLNLRNRKFSA